MAETSGLVQRLKWVAGSSRTLFVYIGPLPEAVRLFTVPFSGTDQVNLAFRRVAAASLLKARNAGLPVVIQHDAGSSIIEQVDVRFTSVRPDGLEVTQAIQNLTHTVPLIALKATVVRAYLSYRLNPAITVRGELTVTRGGTNAKVFSTNSVLLDSAQFGQVNAQRQNAARSLNFVLPVDQTAPGTVQISLTRITDVNTDAEVDIGLIRATVTVTFVASAPLRVRILGMSYQFGAPPATHVPSDLDFGLLASWLRRAYPVAQVISSRAVVTANAAPAFTCGQINAQVAAIRALDVAGGVDNRTHYYGLVSDGGFFMRGCAAVPGSPDPTAVGSGPTGPASWGWDFDGSYGDWYGGHELGHTFGRRHPGFCGESSDDPSYPFASGQLSNADQTYAGFDVGDSIYGLPMTALPGVVWHDVMTYCSNQWLSSYTYTGIRARLLAEEALGAGASPGAAGRPDERFPAQAETKAAATSRRTPISVIATVNLTQQQGEIQYVNPLARGELSPAEPNSAVVLEARRLDGSLLDRYPVAVKPLSDPPPGQDQLALVNAIIAAPPDARRIDLSVGGRTVDTFQAGGAEPAVRNLKQAPSERGDRLSLSWESAAAPGDRHSFIIQASTDKGRTWQTMAVGLTSPEVAIDMDQFRGAAEVLVRVIETDGFTYSDATSEYRLR